VERYSAGGQQERAGELAREVVRARPDVIVFSGNSLAFKRATPTIPLVGVMGDPIALGLVTSLAHPGGNITGISTDAGIKFWTKHLEMVREIVPMATKVGWLASPGFWNGAIGRTLSDAANQAGISLLGPPLASPINEEECRRVLLAMAREQPSAVICQRRNRNLRLPVGDCWLG
jgi:putative ABC transport system substrate-binding protein